MEQDEGYDVQSQQPATTAPRIVAPPPGMPSLTSYQQQQQQIPIVRPPIGLPTVPIGMPRPPLVPRPLLMPMPMPMPGFPAQV